MPRGKSIGMMISELMGALEEGIMDDAGEWPRKFVVDIYDKTSGGERTTHLSINQVDKIDELHQRYC